MYERLIKRLQDQRTKIETALNTKAASGTIDEIRFLAGQYSGLSIAHSIIIELRKEGNQDA